MRSLSSSPDSAHRFLYGTSLAKWRFYLPSGACKSVTKNGITKAFAQCWTTHANARDGNVIAVDRGYAVAGRSLRDQGSTHITKFQPLDIGFGMLG